jgi:hypothetical protein
MTLKDAPQWPMGDIDGPWLEAKGAWLKEERNLHGNSCKFFVTAGSLFIFARYEYALGSVAFFQAILGFEKALKMHYQQNEGYLKELMKKAVADGIINDAILSQSPRLGDHFHQEVRNLGGKKSMTHCEQLCLWLPEQRNQYFHGTYLLSPDHYYLTIQLRRLADALDTQRTQFRS